MIMQKQTSSAARISRMEVDLVSRLLYPHQHLFAVLALCQLPDHTLHLSCRNIIAVTGRNREDFVFWFLQLTPQSINWFSDALDMVMRNTFMETNVVNRSSRSCLLRCVYQRLCQKPWHVRFLNMNADVGSDSGCLDIAPYETICASCPKKRDIAVVAGPLTQLSIKRIGFMTSITYISYSGFMMHTLPSVHFFTVSRSDLSSSSSYVTTCVAPRLLS